MDRQYKVGIVGATGMVGQRFVTLLENHPWFKLTVLAASGRSAGKSYEDAVGSRWAMTTPMPESVKKMTVLDASKVEEVASQVDFVFCAVNMPKDEIKALEEAYAKAECPVVSNNSAHRFTPDVPMVVPEINADHIEIIPAQRKRLGTKRGFIAVKSNCSLQSYVPALHPLMKDFGVSKALVCTYQAISGAGKTFDRMPEIVDNVIPYIGGEEEKSEQEPLKIWGKVEDGKIVRCFYDEIFADHTKDIVYDDLKQFYRQSKYFSTTYEDPFPSGWDRHAWLVCFKDQSDAINKKVCETQDMFDITGLPCVEGPDMGVVWDKPHKDDVALVSNSDATARSVTRPRSPVWNNYLRLAKIVHDEMVKDGAVK